MTQFRYRAVDRSGHFSEGVVEQPSRQHVAEWLAREGLTAVKIDTASGRARPAGVARALPGRRGGGNVRERVLSFTRELSVMLSSGLPLDRSLSILEGLADVTGREMITAIRNDVRKGRTLGDALAARPEFSPFYINMVRAGEAGGALESTLSRMTEYLERAKALRQTILSALTYPAILLGVALFSVIFMLAWVVPSFADLFADMGGQLPLPTRIVMGMGDFMASWWWLVIAVLAGAIWLARRQWADEGFRSGFDRRCLGWPLIGELIVQLETTRFARTLGVLLQGGVSLVNAMAIARATVGNRTLRDELTRAGNALKEGKSLSGALLADSHFPVLALHMVQVGEETGRLEEMLLKVAGIYDDEVNNVVRRLLALLEPVLILSLGLMIAAIILSILVGILGVNELVA